MVVVDCSIHAYIIRRADHFGCFVIVVLEEDIAFSQMRL